MKTKCPFLPLLTLALSAAGLPPLVQAAEVHSRPDTAAPVIGNTPDSGQLTPASGFGAVPSGWTAVELPGPHQVFVHNNDLSKNLEIPAGVPLRLEASAEGAVLAMSGENEPVELSGLRGRWTQFLLNRPVIGYVQTAAPAPAAPVPVPSAATPATGAAPAPVPPAANANARPGTAAPMINLGDGGASALPRLFEGRLESTRHPLRPRRPYDYQIMDERGSRYAYVDVSKLLLTEQLDRYLARPVVIYGTARTVPGTNDLVITAESLRLR